MDPFVLRQFNPDDKASLHIDYDKKLFETKINELYKPENLVDGYAPFCKHLFVENFTEALNYYLEITDENSNFQKCGYEARTEKELAVLNRWFPKEKVTSIKAKFLDIILYSREQIQLENKAMGMEDPNKDLNYDWGIISIKPQDLDSEIHMNPITMMRNALGKHEGGSGVPLDREQYNKSVEFWNKYAIIK